MYALRDASNLKRCLIVTYGGFVWVQREVSQMSHEEVCAALHKQAFAPKILRTGIHPCRMQDDNQSQIPLRLIDDPTLMTNKEARPYLNHFATYTTVTWFGSHCPTRPLTQPSDACALLKVDCQKSHDEAAKYEGCCHNGGWCPEATPRRLSVA